MATTGDAPLTVTQTYAIPPEATAGSDLETLLDAAPFAGTISAVSYVPNATITGAATNYRTFGLKNYGAAGVGTLVPASTAFSAGTVVATAKEAFALTLGNAANVAVNAGDIIAFESTHAGTGITDPGGILLVSYTRGQ